MTSLVMVHWVAAVLKLLPGSMHRLLDAWSHRLAQRKAQRRRERQRATR